MGMVVMMMMMVVVTTMTCAAFGLRFLDIGWGGFGFRWGCIAIGWLQCDDFHPVIPIDVTTIYVPNPMLVILVGLSNEVIVGGEGRNRRDWWIKHADIMIPVNVPHPVGIIMGGLSRQVLVGCGGQS